MAALPVALPASTVIMLRSIADIARSEGEDLSAPETALAGEPAFIFGGRYRAVYWYSCWYRQQSKMKIRVNSSGYGIKRLSARGTKLKTSIITMTYGISSISDFQEHFRGTLKTHVKVRSSRPFCWHFCWYRGNERSQRISLFRTRELSNWPARTMARAPTRTRRLPEFL
jgi:hypothetical protein